jgi:hypothetical protein
MLQNDETRVAAVVVRARDVANLAGNKDFKVAISMGKRFRS